MALFSEQHAKQCETEIEEIEQIALSTSNVQSLPAAAPSLSRPLSILSDFRQRAMTVGLFSDQELYEAEQFDEADNDNTSNQSDDGYNDLGDPDSTLDSDPEEGGKGGYQLTPSGKFQGFFRSRPRASTTRKYSTAGHRSDEEEDGEDEMVSPMSLGLNSISGISSSPAAVTAGGGGSNRHGLHRQSNSRRGRAVRSSDSPHRSPPAPVSLSARLLDDTINNPLHPPPSSVELLPMHSGEKAPPALPNTPPVVHRSPHISPVSATPSPHTSRDITHRTARHAYYSSDDDYDLDTQQEGEFTYNTLLAASRDSGSAASAGSGEAPGAPMLWLTPPSCPAPQRPATRSASSMHGPTDAVGLPPRHPPSSAHSHITSGDLGSRGSSRCVTPERIGHVQGSSDQITPEKTDRDRVGTEAAAGEHANISRVATGSPSDAHTSSERPWQSPSDHASLSTSARSAAVVVTEEQDSAAEGVHEIDCVDDANTL